MVFPQGSHPNTSSGFAAELEHTGKKGKMERGGWEFEDEMARAQGLCRDTGERNVDETHILKCVSGALLTSRLPPNHCDGSS